MIRTDGTLELTPKQKDLFIVNTTRITHSRLTPAQKITALTAMIEGFRVAPLHDEIDSVTVELSAPRMAQLSGLSAATAGECAKVLQGYGMGRDHRREQVTGGRFVSQ